MGKIQLVGLPKTWEKEKVHPKCWDCAYCHLYPQFQAKWKHSPTEKVLKLAFGSFHSGRYIFIHLPKHSTACICFIFELDTSKWKTTWKGHNIEISAGETCSDFRAKQRDACHLTAPDSAGDRLIGADNEWCDESWKEAIDSEAGRGFLIFNPTPGQLAAGKCWSDNTIATCSLNVETPSVVVFFFFWQCVHQSRHILNLLPQEMGLGRLIKPGLHHKD